MKGVISCLDEMAANGQILLMVGHLYSSARSRCLAF
jgi:hypothetical protein